jgi:hypothetical protein
MEQSVPRIAQPLYKLFLSKAGELLFPQEVKTDPYSESDESS